MMSVSSHRLERLIITGEAVPAIWQTLAESFAASSGPKAKASAGIRDLHIINGQGTLGGADLVAILDSLSRLAGLEELHLEEISFSTADEEALKQAMNRAKAAAAKGPLRRLEFVQCMFENPYKIISSFPSTLQSLGIREIPLNQSHIELLGNSLAAMPALESLDLTGCEITDRGASLIVKSLLCSMPTFKFLNLSLNTIANMSHIAQVLVDAAALAAPHPLRHSWGRLSLDGCGIRGVSLAPLTKIVSLLNCQNLNLANNELEESDILRLTRLVQELSCCNVQVVDLRWNQFEPDSPAMKALQASCSAPRCRTKFLLLHG